MNDQLRCVLVQTELLWEDIPGNLDLFSKKLASVSETDLILLPEMFTTGFTMNPTELAEPMDGRSVNWMLDQAKEKSVVIGGSLIILEGGKFYNRFVMARPDGTTEHYDKKHLFTLARENEPYESGNQRVVLDIKGWKVLPLICYDLRFPVWARSQKSADSAWEYDLIVYVANWPTARMNAWDSLLKARAIENQAYCIGVNRIGSDANNLNYSGHTAGYDFMGNPMLDMASQDGLGRVSLEKNTLIDFRKKLPFQEDADRFEFL